MRQLKTQHRNGNYCYTERIRIGHWIGYSRLDENKRNERNIQTQLNRQKHFKEKYERELSKHQDNPTGEPAMYFKHLIEVVTQNIVKLKEQLRNSDSIPKKNVRIRTSWKKPNKEAVEKSVMAYLHTNEIGSSVSVEEVANKTQIHPNLIKKCFMLLNRKGILSQARNYQHEDFEWIASTYTIRKLKE